MRSSSVLVAFSTLASLSTAHFLVNSPSSIGFDDDKEGTAPCGSFTPDFTKTSLVHDFHVGGDAISLKLAHNQANFLFRATLDQTAASGWEQIFPIVEQQGLGNLCEPQITVPTSWAGKKGVIGIACDGPDGILYQCIMANFVSGSATAPSSCTNSSIKATFVSDSKLTALVGAAANTSTTGGSSTSSAPSSTSALSSAKASATKNAAAGLQPGWTAAGASFGNVLTALSMALVGGLFMI